MSAASHESTAAINVADGSGVHPPAQSPPVTPPPAAPPVPGTLNWGRIGLVAGVGGLVLVGTLLATVIGGHAGRHRANATTPGSTFDPDPGDGADQPTVVPVHTIKPKCDPSFTMSVRAPAQVEPYVFADVRSQVAGVVTYIRKAQGSPVKAGEVLVKIAVPDLDEEVRQKDAVVKQREAELKIALNNEKISQAGVAVAAKQVDVKAAEAGVAEANRDYRERFYFRVKKLYETDRSTTGQVVEEAELNYKAALADVARAKAGINKCEADLQESHAKLESVRADILLKQEMIEVARKDRDRAKALANYANITARWDGIITRRTVDPGSFVQNAATGHSEPLLRIERRDIVTVVMKVPDEFAPLVTDDTEAIVELSDFRGRQIHGKVTRYSPTLETQSNDHTLPVYVDLFNGTEADYQRFLEKEKATDYADLKDGPLPLLPQITGASASERYTLLPGMYGEMQLVFRKLPNVVLVPSDAIVRHGGVPYLWFVRDGKAHMVQVDVPVDDQKLAKVLVLDKKDGRTVKRDLTEHDEIIYSNLSELSDGQSVAPIPGDWGPHQ